MITLVRVDDRLLHGQVIHAWVPSTASDMLVVVADESAQDILEKELSGFASDYGFEIKILDCRAAGIFLKNPALEGRRIMVVLSSIAAAVNIYDAGFYFTRLNIGNIHHADYKTKLSSSVMITEAEQSALERLVSSGVTLDVMALPEDKKKSR